MWDDADIPALELMTEAVHRHGALAAIELVHAGMNANNDSRSIRRYHNVAVAER